MAVTLGSLAVVVGALVALGARLAAADAAVETRMPHLARDDTGVYMS